MIRLKNKVLPVWFQWDGDESALERAKQTIIDDIVMNGFDHYDAYADITARPTEDESNWDGKSTKRNTSKAKPRTDISPNKKSKSKGLPKGDFISENEGETTTAATKTAS